jgi:TetR/AcrR family transcriptional regulator
LLAVIAKHGLSGFKRVLMPKETFFNLPEEKRANITNIAIKEFANQDYGEVSISRIVAQAGIAKGSFYQYFEDKEDLYSYLLEYGVQKKWEVLGLDHPDPQHIGIFRYLLWTAEASVQIQLLYPDVAKMAYRALNRNSFPEKFWAHAQEETHKFFLQLIAIGKEQGDIAPEVDDDLAAFIFSSVFSGLGQFLLPRVLQPQPGQSESDRFENTFFVPEVMRIYEQTLNLLENGMGKTRVRGGEGQNSEADMILKEVSR